MRKQTLLGAAALLALAGAARPASAQSSVGGIALEQFEAAPAGDPFFGVTSPLVIGHLVPRAAVLFDYAQAPLRLLAPSGSTAIVASQGFLRADVSFALWDRVLVSADMPFALVQSGNEPGNGVTFNVPTSPAVGDLRLGARARIFGDRSGPFAGGAEGFVFVPTAPSGSYVGDGSARGIARALVGGRLDLGIPIVWNAEAGAHIRSSSNPSSFLFGGGIAALLLQEKLQIGPEAYGAVALGGKNPLQTDSVIVTTPSTVNAELLLGARYRISSFQIGVAGGPGLTAAIGTPQFRVVGMVGWVPESAAAPVPTEGGKTTVASSQNGGAAGPKDSDGDGFNDDVDACPNEKGELQGDPAKDGCPLPDRDKDGVLDVDDACPNLAGQRRADITKNGCPDDTDGDGIYDPLDACKDQKGVANADAKLNGCPVDSDGDGIFDDVDACPNVKGSPSKDPRFNGCTEDIDGDEIKNAEDACPFEKGIHTKDPKDNGCMKWVRVTDKEIQILMQVQFKVYGKNRPETIDPVSDDLLKEVRDAISQHPEIKKIEVQGHTDDSGDTEFNNHLSQERADAVRQWLITAGVPAGKLVAKGYGSTVPIADNRIKDGRQKNRRVAFVVTDRGK
jgi:outer membrane protein OmpA-like peptidoglycan-associated protein